MRILYMKKKVVITFTDEDYKIVNKINTLFQSIYHQYYNLIDDEEEENITNGKEIKSVLKMNLNAILQLLTLVINNHERNYDTEP